MWTSGDWETELNYGSGFGTSVRTNGYFFYDWWNDKVNIGKIHRGDESRARRIESWTKVLVSPVSAELIAYAVLVEEVRRKTDV